MSRRPWVNYHHLLYFKTIAGEGSISKAAKKLRLGQPTLSTQMRQFEHTLGYELFDRSKRQITLTEAGRMIMVYATEIFKLGDEMLDALSDQLSASKIGVQIGVTDTVPKHLAHKVFQHAQRSFDCVVTMRVGHGEELLRELHAHRLDLVLSTYPPPVGSSRSFYARSIGRMPVIICGSAQFAKLKRGFPRSLMHQPFIMPSTGSKIRLDVEHFLKVNDISVSVKGDVQDTSLQKLMAINGDGLIPIAAPAVAEHLHSKSLLEIGTLENVNDEMWLIGAERKIANPIAQAIMKDFKLTF